MTNAQNPALKWMDRLEPAAAAGLGAMAGVGVGTACEDGSDREHCAVDWHFNAFAETGLVMDLGDLIRFRAKVKPQLESGTGEALTLYYGASVSVFNPFF